MSEFYIIYLSVQIYNELTILFVKVSGADPPRPAVSFVHFGFDGHLMGVIRRSEYAKPTSIQAQVRNMLFIKNLLKMQHLDFSK